MLINEDTRNEETESLRNWDKIDEWGTQDSKLDHSRNGSFPDKLNTNTIIAGYKTKELEISSPLSPDKTLNKFSESSEINCLYVYPEATEKSDVESLDEMKESFVPVVVGSANESNDFMV